MKKIILLHCWLFIAIPSFAQKIARDTSFDGHRYIETYTKVILTPKKSVFPISLSLVYYGGYKLRFHSRYKLPAKSFLKISLTNGDEITFYPYTSYMYEDKLGLIKEKKIYDIIYQIDEEQLEKILSSSIQTIGIGSEESWFSKSWKNNQIGKWLSIGYKNINKRLSK